jgi:hypothetical protein
VRFCAHTPYVRHTDAIASCFRVMHCTCAYAFAAATPGNPGNRYRSPQPHNRSTAEGENRLTTNLLEGPRTSPDPSQDFTPINTAVADIVARIKALDCVLLNEIAETSRDVWDLRGV